MKKILLTMAIMGCALLGKSQIVVLNELYTDPGSGNSEFFELYNNSGAVINTDCYTIITYYTESGPFKEGFYVMDLPSGTVAPTGFYVGASANPFNVQGTTGASANFSWNAMPASGSLTKWERNGTSYTNVSGTIPANFNDFFQRQTGNGAGIHVLVYANGVLVNAFFGGTSTTIIPTAIRNMPNLSVDMLGTCTDFTAKFDAVNLPDNRGEYVTATTGNDNGYIRQRDGQCGAWEKSSSQVHHTPGSSNGAASATGTLTVGVGMPCVSSGTTTLSYSVASGAAAAAYPVTVLVYEDLGRTDPGTTPTINENLLSNGIFDVMDTIVQISAPIPSTGGSGSYIVSPIVSPTAYTFPFPVSGRDPRNFFVVFQTPQGCYDQVRFLPLCNRVLPVDFKSFTAARNHSNVLLTWVTSTEQNNSGFAVERNIGNSDWLQIAFVPTQATGGNSFSDLTYSYNDLNSLKGISQYRIKQVDMDGRSKYSVIRAVRGEGQLGTTIVFPNPSNDGSVKVVFEDANATRDISVTDMSGRMVKQMKGVTNNNIQIENLTPGMYSLRVVDRETGEQVVQKIVVNKR